MNEFTKQDEYIFIEYEEIIKNPYPFILKQLRDKYKQYYEDFINFSKIDNLNDDNLLRLCLQRTEKNILRYIAKKSFDFDKALDEVYNKFDDMYINLPLMNIGKNIPLLLSQKFTKKIYIYSEKYDKRIHFDIQSNFNNMTDINYVTGDFHDVMEKLEGITAFILSDINKIIPIVHHKRSEYTNILLAQYGYNYTMIDDKLSLRIPLDEYVKGDNIFKYVTFMPTDLSNANFSQL